MATVIVAGFEPFGGETLNASWEAVRRLDDDAVDGATILKLQLPVVFGAAFDPLAAMIAEVRPRLVLLVGQAAGRAELCLERVAVNLDDSAAPDNAGVQPAAQPIDAAGPAAFFSPLPLGGLVAELRACGIPARVSDSAGTFVCNHVLYRALALAGGAGSRVGFLHVPITPAQAAARATGNRPLLPSMSTELVLSAIRQVLALALRPTTGGERQP